MIYSVLVKPSSKKGPLVEQSGCDLTVFLREKPIAGAANQALMKLLAQHFRVSRTSIILKTGSRSKHKLIEIPDIPAETKKV